MPIQFACPRCGRLLSIATRKAGSDVACPACAQRIIVPTPVPPEPLPGILVEPGPTDMDQSVPPPETDAPVLLDVPEPETHHDSESVNHEPYDDLDPIILRRRRRRQWSVNPVVLGGAAFLAIVTLIMVVAAVIRSDRATQQNAAVVGKQPDRATQAKGAPERMDVYREQEKLDNTGETNNPVEFIGRAIGLVVILAVYFTPSVIAIARKHNNIAPILVVNFFLGWLCVGWVIALAWAFTDLKHLENRRRSWL